MRIKPVILAASALFFYSNFALAEVLISSPAATGGDAVAISSSNVSSPYDLIRGTIPPSTAGEQKVPWFSEKLEYEVKWGIFSMGTAYIEVKEVVNFNGQPAYHIVSEAKTNGFADNFYKVRDKNESWVGVKDLRSLGYYKQLREGEFYRDEWVVYDYEKNSFLAKQTNKDGSFHYSSGTVSGPVQDILSSVYSIRPKKLEVGDEVVMDVNTRSNWPLVVKVTRRKMIKVPAGHFRTVIVEPAMRKEGIFIQKGTSMKVYLTNDKRHIPVLIQVDISFGTISIYLTEIHR